MKIHHRPEASIFERYITKEVVEFYTNYLSDANSIGIPKSRHTDIDERGIQGINVKSMAQDVVIQAYFYIMNNIDEVQPFIDTHKIFLREKYPRMSDKLLLIEHNKRFIDWFNKSVSNDRSASEILKWLLYEPKFCVITWTAYDIGHYTFYIKSKDDRSTMQNSGVMVEDESMYFSSSKDKNIVLATTTFYGVIDEIWEINHVIFKVALFKCKWIPNNRNGVHIDDLGFTQVDLGKTSLMTEPFIVASQANQVFYATDPSDISEKWSIILQRKHIPLSDESLDIPSTPSYTTQVTTSYGEVDGDVVHAIRIDHEEGI
ncbi:unnamed protein product [Lathyrus sativus]|nr:unnamed protein product [Lathyrus sativus]